MNPYEPPKADPLTSRRSRFPTRQEILENPDSGPLARLMARRPKTTITFLLMGIAASEILIYHLLVP